MRAISRLSWPTDRSTIPTSSRLWTMVGTATASAATVPSRMPSFRRSGISHGDGCHRPGHHAPIDRATCAARGRSSAEEVGMDDVVMIASSVEPSAGCRFALLSPELWNLER
jgi:hypothetical protein